MNKNISTGTLLLLLGLISAVLIGFMIGCDEKNLDSPIVGPAAGSGPVGGGESQRMRLTATPSKTLDVVGDEQATIKITAFVMNTIGQAMPDGTPVYWRATIGTLDATTQTTSNGAATVGLTFPKTYSGCSVVSAEAGDVEDSISVCISRQDATPTPSVTPTPAKAIIVSTEQGNIAHRGKTTISAYIATSGKPEPGVLVKFSTSGGGTFSESAAITDDAGYARVTFTGNNTSATDITATITASTDDGRTGTVTIIVGGGATPTPSPTPTKVPTAIPTIKPTAVPTVTSAPPMATPTPAVSISLTPSPSTMTCSTSNSINFTATVSSSGGPVQNAQVTFSVTPTGSGSFNSTSAFTGSGLF